MTNFRAACVAFCSAAVLAFAVPGMALAQSGPPSVSDLAARLTDAVVNISSTRMVPGGMPFPVVPEGSPLEEFFNQRNPNFGEDDDRLFEAASLGSGFLISADGLIITNNHVIDGADEIVVFLSDGTRLVADLVGQDEKTDLALLQVETDADLTWVELGDSDSAEVGDWVMAIGNPFGLGGSVSLGIVSARNRDINTGPYDDFIQTDAAINQGNSGGPLFDMNGDVVGINTAILSRTGASLGIGFAIPINLAAPVIAQLSEFGETRRGWLGVGITEVTDDLVAELSLDSTAGALVMDVTRGGPGEDIILPEDVILEFDGRQIVRMRDLPRFVAETPVGTPVTIVVWRGGERVELEITLGRLETGEEIIAQNNADAAEEALSRNDGEAPQAR